MIYLSANIKYHCFWPGDSKPGLEIKHPKLLADYFQQGLEPSRSSKHKSFLLLCPKT